MAQKQTNGNTEGAGGAAASSLPIVVRVRPGTAADKSLRVVLDPKMADRTLDAVIKHAADLTEEDGLRREDLRVQERLKKEMTGQQYGISVNGQGAVGDEPLKQYLAKATAGDGGIEFLQAEIIVAARQEGAYTLESAVARPYC